jgi:LPS-assembly lipoprotein
VTLAAVLVQRRRRWLSALAASGAAVLVAGCGFELRRAPVLAFKRIAFVGFERQSLLAAELKLRIEQSDARVVARDAQPQVVLQVITDKRERSVVASTAAGQVRELQLRVNFEFRLATDKSQELIPATALLLSRDMSYSETFALAKEQEEAQLFRAMQTDIVGQVTQRLARVRLDQEATQPLTPAARP